MVDKIKAWICKHFEHKWKIVPTNDYHSHTWKCERCGETQVISNKRY